MRHPFRSILIVSFAFTLTACGSPKSFDSVSVRGPMHSQQKAVNTMNAGNLAIGNLRAVVSLVEETTRRRNNLIAFPRSLRAATPAPPEPLVAAVSSTSSLPPDWVIQRESGGDYNAFNPTGCGGAGCFGAYQFSGEWAGKLGLPEDLSTATPEQQDEAARELWANGAGCSHWAAC